MAPVHTVVVVIMSLVAAASRGCPDHHGEDVSSSPPPNKTFFKCTACLVDDPAHCATNTPVCGDSTEEWDSTAHAHTALCDTLSPADLARRPTPPGFKPGPFAKNACYDWPDDAFKTTCTTFSTHCERVPIH